MGKVDVIVTNHDMVWPTWPWAVARCCRTRATPSMCSTKATICRTRPSATSLTTPVCVPPPTGWSRPPRTSPAAGPAPAAGRPGQVDRTGAGAGAGDQDPTAVHVHCLRTAGRLQDRRRHGRPRAAAPSFRRRVDPRPYAGNGHRAEERFFAPDRPVHPPDRPAQGRHGRRGQHRHRQQPGRRVVPAVRQPVVPGLGQLGTVDRLHHRRPGRQPADGALADPGGKRLAVRHRGQRQPDPCRGDAPSKPVERGLWRARDLRHPDCPGHFRSLPHACRAAEKGRDGGGA